TLTPIPVSTATDVIDTTKGTVHMVIGSGGTSAPSNGLFFTPARCRVITGVGAPDPATGKRPPIYLTEDAPWSAVRDPAHAYVFAPSTAAPAKPGAMPPIQAPYSAVPAPFGALPLAARFPPPRPRGGR